MSDRWSKPTRREVEQALASIADVSLRSLFFRELLNPEWLTPLATLGVFKDPPEPQVNAKGVETTLPWPEGDYLVHVAVDRPQEVAQILDIVSASRNPWVQRAVLSAASKMPSEYAKELAAPIAKIVRASVVWLNPDEIISIVSTLSAGNEVASVRVLLKPLLEPLSRSYGEAPADSATHAWGGMDDYVYTELLRALVPVLAKFDGIEGLKLIGRYLQGPSERRAGSGPEREEYAASSIWRRSIAPHAQNSGAGKVMDSLIDAVRDVAIELGRLGREVQVIEYLDSARSFLLRRIAVEVATQLLASNPVPPDAVAAAQPLLFDRSLMGIGSRPEYVRLARALLPHLTEADRLRWVELVQSGSWQGTDDDMRRLAAWGQENAEDVGPEEVSETRQRLLHRFLQPLDGSLPSPLDDELAAFEDKWGKLEHPEFGSYSSSFTGPTSPKSRTQLLDMSPEELAAYLEKWTPIGAGFFGPSIQGLAQELESATVINPALVASIADKIFGLGRSYVRAALTGWAKAVPSGYEPTDAVWQLVSAVIQEPDDGTDDLGQRDFDADAPVWRWAQRSVVDLVSAYVEAMPKPVPSAAIAQMWELLKPLTNHADPTVEHESRYGGSNMDPLTLSLNTTRPAALRAAIKLASPSNPPDRRSLSETTAEILQVVAQHVDGFSDKSLAVAAVIGEGLGRIWGVDPAWIESRRTDLFCMLERDDARRARSDVIVSVALRVYRTNEAFLQLIRPAITQILSKGYGEIDHIDGWRTDRSPVDAAALHMVAAYLLQIVERDDPELQRVFSQNVPVDVASEVLGRVGWQIMRTSMDGAAQSIPPDYLQRARALIDWRVAEIRSERTSVRELSQFYWWVQSGVFEPSWWLPILQLEIEERNEHARGMLGKPLAEAASSEPALAITVFEQVYGARTGDWRDYDLVQHAPLLLATALQSGIEMAIAGANRIKDTLGRQGQFEALMQLEQLLANVRGGEVDR